MLCRFQTPNVNRLSWVLVLLLVLLLVLQALFRQSPVG
jgi:hypothetical protein